MAARPSEAIIRLLRDTAQKKGLNTASLARQAGIERARLKHLLAGSEPMTVDEFMQLATALQLNPQDLGLAGDAGDEGDEAEEQDIPRLAGPTLRAIGRRDHVPDYAPPDPYGNHAEQALRLGFALGCDMFFLTDVKLLGDSGVPRSVLSRYPENLPIRLDAAFHRHNDPTFLPEGLQIRLSFDSLYTCVFPWAAFRQITFFPLPPSDPETEEDDTDNPPKGQRRGHLRLVE